MLLGMLSALGCASHERLTKPPLAAPLQSGEGTTWVSSFEPYPRLAAALHASGIATAVIHPRGAGFSDGLRGDIGDYGQFLDDLRLGLERTRDAFPGKPIFVFGHSAGAALALDLAVKQQSLAGVILVNPAYKLTYADGMGPTLIDAA